MRARRSLSVCGQWPYVTLAFFALFALLTLLAPAPASVKVNLSSVGAFLHLLDGDAGHAGRVHTLKRTLEGLPK